MGRLPRCRPDRAGRYSSPSRRSMTARGPGSDLAELSAGARAGWVVLDCAFGAKALGASGRAPVTALSLVRSCSRRSLRSRLRFRSCRPPLPSAPDRSWKACGSRLTRREVSKAEVAAWGEGSGVGVPAVGFERAGWGDGSGAYAERLWIRDGRPETGKCEQASHCRPDDRGEDGSDPRTSVTLSQAPLRTRRSLAQLRLPAPVLLPESNHTPR